MMRRDKATVGVGVEVRAGGKGREPRGGMRRKDRDGYTYTYGCKLGGMQSTDVDVGLFI